MSGGGHEHGPKNRGEEDEVVFAHSTASKLLGKIAEEDDGNGAHEEERLEEICEGVNGDHAQEETFACRIVLANGREWKETSKEGEPGKVL